MSSTPGGPAAQKKSASASSASAATAAARPFASAPAIRPFDLVYVAGESSAGAALVEKFPASGNSAVSSSRNGIRTPCRSGRALCIAPLGRIPRSLAKVPPQTRIVDIGGDHRFVDGWTYGLADVWPDQIRGATRLANPGCYPSASIAALAPLLAGRLIEPRIIIDAKSGVSGAGRGGGGGFGFAEVNEDVSAYGLFKHAHVPEMVKALRRSATPMPRSRSRPI